MLVEAETKKLAREMSVAPTPAKDNADEEKKKGVIDQQPPMYPPLYKVENEVKKDSTGF